MGSIEQIAPTDSAGIWTVFVLVSPTRSSLAGIAQKGQLIDLVAWHNGETEDSQGPPETALLRPWRVAKSIQCSSRGAARHGVERVCRASGFRARLAALSDWRRSGGPTSENMHEENQTDLRLSACLDAMTYVPVDFVHPSNAGYALTVRTLVDTGSTDCDLKQAMIDKLGLPLSRGGGYVQFETAAGRKMERSLYDAIASVSDVQVRIRLSPVDEDEDQVTPETAAHPELCTGVAEGEESDSEKELEDIDRAFGFGSNTDDAVLGHMALASLGLLVDCRSRQLVPMPKQPIASLQFLNSSSPHVHVEVINPMAPHRRARVLALVDTGSTDMDVGQRIIDSLGLQIDTSERPAQFETAGGVTVEAPIYRAIVSILGREASVRVSPSEAGNDPSESDDSDENQENEEEALLGHDVLAALGLLVDCRNKRLVAVSAA